MLMFHLIHIRTHTLILMFHLIHTRTHTLILTIRTIIMDITTHTNIMVILLLLIGMMMIIIPILVTTLATIKQLRVLLGLL